ncbi:hypothetical protein [Streptomyces longwoodensis]|uniref:hypothetical protein n=1 Tax=Streptomyces longwoodensis TaxID=68231 RepID=UPI0036E83CDF
MGEWFASAIGALIGAMGGGLLTPWVTAHFARRSARHKAFDQAIAAVRATLYTYTGPSQVNQSALGSPEQASAFNSELPARHMERFFEATYEMRKSIANLEPYYIPNWNREKFQLSEVELITLAEQIRKAR